jgi:hypothetical protein
MPQFVPNGPVVPDKLVQELEEDRVVIFCGAGVSMGAGLPDYNGLVKHCYDRLTHPAPPKGDPEWLWPDRLLGSLESRFSPDRVREVAAARLSRRPRDLTLHRAILRLSRMRRNEGMRLVTTNFDTYFERARRGLRFGLDFQHHAGPILPIPRDDLSATWRSLVYLHGRLGGPPQHLVLTSADFGRAYLTEGWAARFIVRLFADFTVLFLGYSLNDPVLRYMTDAFAAENLELRTGQRRGPAYILTSYDGPEVPDGQHYRDRNLEPIYYSSASGHAALRETIVQWADWRDDYLASVGRLISEIAPRLPDAIDPTDTANLVWAVAGRAGDAGFGARTFADVEPLPPVGWLSIFETRDTARSAEHQKATEESIVAGRPKPPPLELNISPLFPSQLDRRSIGLTPTSFALIKWLCRHLDSLELVEYVIEKMAQGRTLHPRVRQAIRRRIPELPDLRAGFQRFWRIVSSEGHWIGGRSPDWPGSLWNVQGAYPEGAEPEWLRQELVAGMRPLLDFSRSTYRDYRNAMHPERAGEAVGEHISQIADADVVLADGNHLRGMIDTVNGRPGADIYWATLSDDLTSLLSQVLHLFATADEANADHDPSALQRPSVEPHAQNYAHRQWTHLFDLIWRGWMHIDAEDRAASRAIVARWRMIPFLSFRRLVAAAVTRSAHFTSDEKVEVLLNG